MPTRRSTSFRIQFNLLQTCSRVFQWYLFALSIDQRLQCIVLLYVFYVTYSSLQSAPEKKIAASTENCELF